MSLTGKLSAWALCASLAFSPAVSSAQVSLKQPMVKTPMSRTELLVVLRESHMKIFGKEPSPNRLAMAWAQVALENDQGRQVYNKNIGNIIKTDASQKYFLLGVHNRPYRSFDSFGDSAAIYWSVMQRCSPALSTFDHADYETASVWLKKCGYYEADVAAYVAGMKLWYYEAKIKVMPEEENERHERELQQAIHDAICAENAAAGITAEDIECD